jgi:hypothetical protein
MTHVNCTMTFTCFAGSSVFEVAVAAAATRLHGGVRTKTERKQKGPPASASALLALLQKA